VQRYLLPGNEAAAAELGEKASATLAAHGVLAAAVLVAAKPAEQAVQQYARTWLVAAVTAAVAAREAATAAVLVLSRCQALTSQRL